MNFINPERNSSEGLEEVVVEEKPLHENNSNYSPFDKFILAYMTYSGFGFGKFPARGFSDYIKEGEKIDLVLGMVFPLPILISFAFGLSWLNGYVYKSIESSIDVKKKQAITRDLFISGILGTTLGAIYFYSGSG